MSISFILGAIVLILFLVLGGFTIHFYSEWQDEKTIRKQYQSHYEAFKNTYAADLTNIPFDKALYYPDPDTKLVLTGKIRELIIYKNKFRQELLIGGWFDTGNSKERFSFLLDEQNETWFLDSELANNKLEQLLTENERTN